LWSSKVYALHREQISLDLSSHLMLSILFSLEDAATSDLNPQERLSRPSKSTPFLAQAKYDR
jgi:hypothetical protein